MSQADAVRRQVEWIEAETRDLIEEIPYMTLPELRSKLRVCALQLEGAVVGQLQASLKE